MQEIEEKLEVASDTAFRSRALHEYRTVAKLTEPYISLSDIRILDFGCGEGIAAASFALRLPEATVFGVDIRMPNIKRLRQRFQQQVSLELPSNLTLTSSAPGELPNEITELDLIFAWSVFEHVSFPQIVDTMRLLKGRLRSKGLFFLQISPLYFSPKGSHLYRFDPSPWVHLLQETQALKAMVMNSAEPEAAKHHVWGQFETLNRATADDIVAAAVAAGFSVEFEERLRVPNEPPTRLTRAYNHDALVTEEMRLLLRSAPI
jgi:SAM-dependent methyltransferase